MKRKVLAIMVGMSLVLTCAPGIFAASLPPSTKSPSEMNQKDKAKPENEPADKQDQQKKKPETELAKSQAEADKANAQARKVRNDKVNRIRGKQVSSWQLINR
jgi:hypothetical protein